MNGDSLTTSMERPVRDAVEMKNFFIRLQLKRNNWLLKMAKANEKMYGGKKLDCCSMNKPEEYGKNG